MLFPLVVQRWRGGDVRLVSKVGGDMGFDLGLISQVAQGRVCLGLLLNRHFLRPMVSFPVIREEGMESHTAGKCQRLTQNLLRQAVLTHGEDFSLSPGATASTASHCPITLVMGRTYFLSFWQPQGMVTDGIVPYLSWTGRGCE